MKSIIVCMFAAVTLWGCNSGSSPGSAKNEPGKSADAKSTAEKGGADQASPGAIRVLGFSPAGTLAGSLGRVTLEAREIFDPDNPKAHSYGVRVTVNPGLSELGRESSAFVDYDELQPLTLGIDRLAKMDGHVTSMEHFDARYQTRNGFALGVYDSRGGAIQAFVSTGNSLGGSATLKLADLPSLRGLFADAKAKLDAAKAAAVK